MQPKPTHQPGTSKGEEKPMEEGKEAGRHKAGRTGAKRPTEKSTARAYTGINPKEPMDPQSPNLQTP